MTDETLTDRPWWRDPRGVPPWASDRPVLWLAMATAGWTMIVGGCLASFPPFLIAGSSVLVTGVLSLFRLARAKGA